MLGHLAEIQPGREVRTLRVDHRGPDRRIEFAEHPLETEDRRVVDGVAFVRPVERDHQHRALEPQP